MKKTLLSLAVAMAAFTGSASAAVIDNDTNQSAFADLQLNGVVDVGLVDLGSTSVVGTNLVNTANTSITAFNVAGDNDIVQVGDTIGQGNGIVSAAGVDVGNTRVIGTNSVNYADSDILVGGVVGLAIENDVSQDATFVGQGNGILEGGIVNIGSARVTGTNLVNTATTSIGSIGIVSGVIENDISQNAADIAQVNGIVQGSGVSVGGVSVTGVNSINSATSEIGSLGLILNGVAGNDIGQTSTDTLQANVVVDAQVLGAGNARVTGTNLINTAERTVIGAGAINGVIGNGIVQDAENADQDNGVLNLAGGNLGNVRLTGVNAVNVATSSITVGGLVNGVGNNDITQGGSNIDQDNTVLVGNVIGLGLVANNGVNVANQAAMTIDTVAIGNGIIGNDIGQELDNTVQTNFTGVLSGVQLGNVRLTGVNAINTATMDIDSAGLGLIAGNTVGQTAIGNAQINGIAMGAGASVGNVRLTGTNTINASSVNITQSIP